MEDHLDLEDTQIKVLEVVMEAHLEDSVDTQIKVLEVVPLEVHLDSEAAKVVTDKAFQEVDHLTDFQDHLTVVVAVDMDQEVRI